MQVEVEELEGLQRRLKVELPIERVEKAYQERLKEIAKKTRLPGFRPGKAPLQVVEKRIGQSLRREIASEMMQSGFQQAVVDNKLKIAGSAEVKPGEIAKDKPLKFEVWYEAYPEVELVDFDKIIIEKASADITDTDVSYALEKIQRQHAKWHDVTRAAQIGDRVVIDFEGFIEKKPFPGGSAKNLTLELGSHEMVAGFEEGLVGVTSGELKDINLSFPEHYPLTNLANQKVLFKVTVHHVQEAELPPLDDEFAQKIGSAEAITFDQLQQKTQQGLQQELTRNLRALVKKQVLDQLIALNPVTAPQTMINDEIKHLQDITRQQLSMQQGRRVEPQKIELPRDPYVAPATRRVVLGLLIAEIIKKFELKLDKERARQQVQDIVSAFPNPEEMANFYQNNKRLMAEIEASVLEEQVVDKLLELVQAHEKQMSFEQVLNQVKQQGE